jgi:hypothetical protein
MCARYGRVVTQLPFIDRPAVEVGAPPEVVWRALTGYWGSGAAVEAPFADLFVRAIGVRERGPDGRFPAVGSTVRGFRVGAAEPPRRLLLEGRHRFSVYELEFEIEPAGDGRSTLAGITRAAFPGAAGRLYRLAVIDAGTHRLAMRRMLGAIRSRAERA